MTGDMTGEIGDMAGNKTCTECGKTFLGTRSMCEACRKRLQRAKKGAPPESQPKVVAPGAAKVVAPAESQPKEEVAQKEVTQNSGQQNLTSVDREFDNYKPGYYKFEELRQGKCLLCGQEFKTHLKYLKFCSLRCYKDGPMIVMAKGPYALENLAKKR